MQIRFFKFFEFDVFVIDFILFDVDDIIDQFNQIVNSSQILYQHIVITLYRHYDFYI